MTRHILQTVLFAGFAILAACGGEVVDTNGPGAGTTDTDPGTTGPTVEPVDTANPDPDEGSLMLIRRTVPQGKTTELMGLFVDQHPGFANLAQCAVAGGVCLSTLPTVVDDYVDIDTSLTFDPQFSEYRYVGLTVGLGNYEADYSGDGVNYYYRNLTSEVANNNLQGDMGVRYGVEWGDYQGSDDILVSADIELMNPRPNANLKFHDGDQILIEWAPNGEGDIYLTVTGGILLSRMYLLEDDGYFELDASSLGFGTDSADINFTLQRWNTSQVVKRGNVLDVVVTSEVSFSGEYFYVGGRQEIELADTCAEATTAAITQSGGYWGRLADWGYSNDIDPGNNGCTGWQATGAEGMFRVELGPLQHLSAEYVLLTDDASVYILEDCYSTNTCLAGADLTYDGDPEYLGYFNNSDETKTVYLVADGYNGTDGVFYMDITIDQVLEPDMYNTCPEAMVQPTPMAAGTYYTSFLPYTNQLDPGLAGCTGKSAVGADSMSQVEVGPGQTITVNIEMTGGDPAIYLLYNCTNTLSCAVGADGSVGAGEAIAYTNTTNVTETLYLVIDTRGTLRPYFLTVDIQ